ncbi:MAG: ASCH domain-containing protein [Chloroflexi bacterium]|nr:ASCH domain-containing protein [Chloroflexota bacterium]
MSRLMAVSLTEQAVVERRKTVTRRLRWLHLKPGDRLTLVRKSMGRKPGEPLVRLAEVEVVSVRREPLRLITDDDITREGVPVEVFTPVVGRGHEDICSGCRYANWVAWYARTFGITTDTEVTRIEWRYL